MTYVHSPFKSQKVLDPNSTLDWPLLPLSSVHAYGWYTIICHIFSSPQPNLKPHKPHSSMMPPPQ